MTPPSVAVAELAPSQAPDVELHNVQQLAMRSVQQAVHDLQTEQAQPPQQVSELDMGLAEHMRDSLGRRTRHMEESDPYLVTARAILLRLTNPTQEAIDGALALINDLAQRDEADGKIEAVTPRPQDENELNLPAWFFSFTPTDRSIKTAQNIYQYAKQTKNEETVRAMIAYFNEFNIDIPQTA